MAERFNVVVRNARGNPIAARTNIASEQLADDIAQGYLHRADVVKVDVIRFEVPEGRGNGRYR